MLSLFFFFHIYYLCQYFRTYLPSEVPRIVELWKGSVEEKVGQSLASPAQYDNLFPELQTSLRTEQFMSKQRSRPIPASAAVSAKVCSYIF